MGQIKIDLRPRRRGPGQAIALHQRDAGETSASSSSTRSTPSARIHAFQLRRLAVRTRSGKPPAPLVPAITGRTSIDGRPVAEED